MLASGVEKAGGTDTDKLREALETVAIDDMGRPNGLAFSPDETKLYIVDSGITHGGETHIRVFDVDVASGRLTRGKVFVDDIPKPGFTDGLRLDIEGNVWTSMGWADPQEDGVRCYAPNGDLIVSNGDAVNQDPTQLNELDEFTPAGSFVGQFQLDTGAAGGAFGIAVSNANGELRFAAADDDTNSLDVWTFRG